MKKIISSVGILIVILNFLPGCKNDVSPKTESDSSAFAKAHPSPEIVRGFMMNDVFSQKDCADAKAWGANVIRVQMFPASFATDQGKDIWDAWPDFLDRLETQVQYAEQAGLKVVVDLHEPPFQDITEFDGPEFWNRDDLEQPFTKVWEDIAVRLLPYKSTIWGYDLFNEPVDLSQQPDAPRQWRPLAIKILESIRKVDANTWIIFEPGPSSWFSGFKGLQPLPDTKVIYSAHFYVPQEFTHQGVHELTTINIHYPSVIDGETWNKDELEKELKYADEFQARWKVPVYVGEFSVIRWAPKESATRWLQDVIDMFEKRGWSWSYHAFREWQGWSLEHNEKFWKEGQPEPKPVSYETERAAIIKKAFEKN